MVGRSSKREDGRQSPAAEVPAITRLSDYTARADDPQRSSGDAREVSMSNDDSPELPADYGKLGEHVTSVLEAADQAAAEIREEARGAAQELTKRAQQEADALVERARAETETLSHEAVGLRVDAEEESRELKERANAYATEKRREADRQVSALVSQAKRDASEHTRAAQERSAALAENIERSQQRLRQLVDGLRDLAERLEEILREPPAAPQGEGVESKRAEESMEESLRRSAAAQGTSQPKH